MRAKVHPDRHTNAGWNIFAWTAHCPCGWWFHSTRTRCLDAATAHVRLWHTSHPIIEEKS